MSMTEQQAMRAKCIKAVHFRLSASTVLSLCAGFSPALAQSTGVQTPIEDRYRPEYASQPIPLGSLEISPRIEVDIEAINNVFASDVVKRDDVTLSFRPSIAVRDRRTDRQLTLSAGATLESYINNSFSDRLLLNASARARFGLGTRTRPFLGLGFRQNDTSISEFAGLSSTGQPVQLTSLNGNAGLEQEFANVTTTIEARYGSTSFDDGVAADTGVVNSVTNDFEAVSARLRLAYSVNPSQRLYAEGEINDRDYADDAAFMTDPLADRSSIGFTIRAGTSLQLNEILQIDANVGYIKQDFDSSFFMSISSFSFDVGVLYNPTRLTRLRLRASRSIDDSVNPFSNGLLRTEIAFGAEHELLRNLVISAEGRYGLTNSSDTLATITSDVEEFQLSGRIRLLISERWSLRARVSYFERDTLFSGSQLRGLFGLAYSF